MKRALIIGINDYKKISPLGGAANDAEKITALISKHEDGSPNFDTKIATSDNKQITKKNNEIAAH